MRKFLVFLIAFIVVAVIAAFQLPGLLKKEIEKRIIAELDNTIRADFSFQKFDLSSINDFPHISIQMENFLVQGIDNFKGDTLAYSKKVILLFDFWNVYNTQKLDIKGIYLIEPDIRLVVERDSSANFDIFHSAKTNPDIKDSSHFNLMIEKWQIGKGKIEYRDKIESNHIVLDGINHTGKGSFTELVDDLITRTSIIEATVRWRNVKYIHKKPINLDLIVDMNFKDSIFTIKENKASIGHFSFGFEGRFKKISNLYHSDVKFNIKETNFKEILTLLPGVYKKSVEEYHAKGDVAFTGHLNGKFDPVKSQWPGFSAKLVVQNGEIRHPELKASITGINLHLLVENKLGLPDSTNFLIKDFRMMLDDNPVSGYLLVYGTSRPYIKADIKTNTNIEELEKLFKIDSIVAKGNLSLDVEAEGYLDFEKKKFPVLDTKINLTNGYYESPSFPVPFKNIHFVADISNTSGDFKDTKIRIDTLTYAVEDEPFVVKGTIENMNDYTFDIEANGLLDFEKLSKIFPIENTKLSGKVISNIKANGKVSDITSKNYEAINVKGMAIVKNFHYSNPEFNHRLDVKDAIFNFSPEKIRVDKFSGIIGNSTISTKGEVSHYLPFFLANKGILEVNFDIICDSLNLNEWLLQPHKKDTSTEITVYKIPENLNVDIKSQIGRIIFDKLEIDDLKGNIIVKDGVLKIKETGFSTLGSPFKLSMTYDTRDMDSPKFDIEELYIKDLELNKAYNAFYTVQESAPAAQHTNGVFSITYKLKGELKPDMKPNMKSLKGGGIVFIKSAQVNGMRMFDHISSLTKKDELKNPSLQNLMLVSEISKGRLIIKPFKFKVNKYDAELEGFHDFEGTMAYVMKIGIPPFEKAKIPIHIEGEYSKPNIKLGKGHSLDSLKRR